MPETNSKKVLRRWWGKNHREEESSADLRGSKPNSTARLAKGKTGAHDGVHAAYDRGPDAQGLSRSTSLRAENDEKTNSALGLARRESADQETKKKFQRKKQEKVWLCTLALGQEI
jgi:hypothetical protein